MARIFLQHRLERLDERRHDSARFRAARLPVVPRRAIHQRLGIERKHIDVFGELGRCRGHGPLEPRVVAVARADRRDERLLARGRARCQRLRLGRGGHGGRARLRIHRHVDVRPEDVSLAPVAHRALRVVALRSLERALRFRMVEVPRETQALVEVALRLRRAGRDLEAARSQAGDQRLIASRTGRCRISSRLGRGTHFRARGLRDDERR